MDADQKVKPSYPIMQFFSYGHLPPRLQGFARPFCELAERMTLEQTTNPQELAAGLRKLLEAKDCFVRACL